MSNRVAIIAFNSPKTLNALHQKMRFEIIDAIEQSKLIKGDDSRNAIATFFSKEKVFFIGK